jgi:hypothetical protein
VSWNSEAGRVSGLVTRVHTRDANHEDFTQNASEDDLQYEIKSDKTDHIALLHKSRPCAAFADNGSFTAAGVTLYPAPTKSLDYQELKHEIILAADEFFKG